MIEDSKPIVITGLVITEVLQGLTRDIGPIESFLRMWKMVEPAGLATYSEAAAIFRLARSKGVSLTTVDALIAAIALENGAALFTLDQDFSYIARITNLSLYTA